MTLWSVVGSVLDLGFVDRCSAWFAGDDQWGGMALPCHSGAPASYMPRLLADGVGAGRECDRYGHRRRGKESGPPSALLGAAMMTEALVPVGCPVLLSAAIPAQVLLFCLLPATVFCFCFFSQC